MKRLWMLVLLAFCLAAGCATSPVPGKQVTVLRKSPRFRRIEYYAPNKTLRVFPREGLGIEYKDVPMEVYHELLSANPRGKYYDENVAEKYESKELTW